MIQVANLVKRYGRLSAVAGISFEVHPGQVVALLGPNGAGKSTTIKAITGLLRPTSGRVSVAGHDLQTRPTEAKARLGYVPDRPYLYGKLSARELLRYLARLRGIAAADGPMEQWLEYFSLDGAANELIESFSHGMRQKLTFIAALMHQPEVLVIDEPMVGLDPRAAKQVRELISGYAENGRTVLLTTHSMEVAQAVSHHVIVIHQGTVAAAGDLTALQRRVGLDGADLEAIFLELTEQATASEARDLPAL